MYMHIPCWAFTNVGQHLMDTKIDEVYAFEIIELPIKEVDLDLPIVEIPIKEVEIQKVDITVAVDVDETLQDAFVSMFENIAWYIYNKNNITSILAELYT